MSKKPFLTTYYDKNFKEIENCMSKNISQKFKMTSRLVNVTVNVWWKFQVSMFITLRVKKKNKIEV